MKISFIKQLSRSMLICDRQNGSTEHAILGPQTHMHDMAHFIVEKEFKLKQGFFGNIFQGYTVDQLSQKEIIRTLHTESVISEVSARALQSLWSGACMEEQFADLIQTELISYGIDYPMPVDQTIIKEMLADYKRLITSWQALPEGGKLELNMDFTV